MNFDPSWIADHFVRVPLEIVNFLSDGGIDINDKKIVDIGTGDGLIAAGIACISNSQITGLDLTPVDVQALYASLPDEKTSSIKDRLDFGVIESNRYALPDQSVDIVTSWSAAEHFMDLTNVFLEINRILKPEGVAFFQTYPLWFSEHGHHLSTWLPPYWHLKHSRDELIGYLKKFKVLPRPIDLPSIGLTDDVDKVLDDMKITRDELTRLCLESYDSCNRLTLDQICNAIASSNLKIRRIQVMTNTVNLPSDVQFAGITNLLVTGAKMIVMRRQD